MSSMLKKVKFNKKTSDYLYKNIDIGSIWQTPNGHKILIVDEMDVGDDRRLYAYYRGIVMESPTMSGGTHYLWQIDRSIEMWHLPKLNIKSW